MRDAWIQYASARLLGEACLAIDWHVEPKGLEKWSRSVMQVVARCFQERWLLGHSCIECSSNMLVLEGNAKIRTRLRANTDDGVWNCDALQAHCLTGCQSSPIPGRRFCSTHLLDSEPLLGSDIIFANLVAFTRHPSSIQPDGSAAGSLAPLIVTCKRACRALRFFFSSRLTTRSSLFG